MSCVDMMAYNKLENQPLNNKTVQHFLKNKKVWQMQKLGKKAFENSRAKLP